MKSLLFFSTKVGDPRYLDSRELVHEHINNVAPWDPVMLSLLFLFPDE